jgi:acyl-CoA thioester hydrolase
MKPDAHPIDNKPSRAVDKHCERGDTISIRIYYEDTDCGGVVYYANYLKYFERARTLYLENRGLSVAELMKAGRVFVVVHAEVDYRTPAYYGDWLEIETIISEMSPAAMTFSHLVREQESRRLVAKGAARLAVTDGNGKVKRLDKHTVAALDSGPKGKTVSHG